MMRRVQWSAIVLALMTWACDDDATGGMNQEGTDTINCSLNRDMCAPGFVCVLREQGYRCERDRVSPTALPMAGRTTQQPPSASVGGTETDEDMAGGGSPMEAGGEAAPAGGNGQMAPTSGGVSASGTSGDAETMTDSLETCGANTGTCRQRCLSTEEAIVAPCIRGNETCCRGTQEQSTGGMSLEQLDENGGEGGDEPQPEDVAGISMDAAMAGAPGQGLGEGCEQGIAGAGLCLGFFWGHRKCQPDPLGGGADQNGAQNLEPGQNYMGVANYRPGLNVLGSWFKTSLCAGGTITVDLTYPDGGGDLHLQLWATNQGKVGESTDICAGRQRVRWTNRTGENLTARFGIYGFAPPGQDAGENTFTMDLSVACPL